MHGASAQRRLRTTPAGATRATRSRGDSPPPDPEACTCVPASVSQRRLLGRKPCLPGSGHSPLLLRGVLLVPRMQRGAQPCASRATGPSYDPSYDRPRARDPAARPTTPAASQPLLPGPETRLSARWLRRLSPEHIPYRDALRLRKGTFQLFVTFYTSQNVARNIPFIYILMNSCYYVSRIWGKKGLHFSKTKYANK